MVGDVERFVDGLVSARVGADSQVWLRAACHEAAVQGARRGLLMAFGMAPRRVGKAPLSPTAAEQAAADALCPGLSLSHFQLDELLRVRLLQALGGGPAVPDAGTFVATLDRLCADADVGELRAIYRGMCLLPYGPALVPRASEGLRSNMIAVFEAVALHNPYPAAHLPEPAWNQLVLKTVFLELPLSAVHGLAGRHNATLAQALRDHAAERRAAGRALHPELQPWLEP